MRGYVERMEALEKAGIEPTYENVMESWREDVDNARAAAKELAREEASND